MLERELERMQKLNLLFCTNREVWVKITGDGTRISCNINLVIIAFVIIENKTISNSPTDHNTIALINCKENYESINKSVADIFKEIKDLDSLTVGDYTYKLVYF